MEPCERKYAFSAGRARAAPASGLKKAAVPAGDGGFGKPFQDTQARFQKAAQYMRTRTTPAMVLPTVAAERFLTMFSIVITSSGTPSGA